MSTSLTKKVTDFLIVGGGVMGVNIARALTAVYFIIDLYH
jgi:L-2-hydroxyglutarate oxidase LhgO